MRVPKKYLWLVAGFVFGSYLGFSELADLFARIGGDVKGAVLQPSPEQMMVPTSRTPPRPSAYRFYRSPVGRH